MEEYLPPPLPELNENDSNIGTTSELESLEFRRTALQRLVKIAHSAEQLKTGLETTLQLGAPTGKLPQAALKLYESISQKILELSDKDVVLRLNVLDKKILTSLRQVLSFVDQLDNQQMAILDDQSFDKLEVKISDFRRLTQTAAALRVLLNRRNIPVAPLPLAIPKQQLKQKINVVEDRETQCREKAVAEIVILERDLHTLLNSPSCNETMRVTLQQVLNDLHLNREHIAAGKSIHDLPVSMAEVIMREERPQAVKLPAEAPTVFNYKMTTPTTAQTSKSTSTEEENATFGDRFSDWLESPWNEPIANIFKKK